MFKLRFFLICLITLLPAFSQTYRSAIVGNVVDASGSVILGAKVVIQQEDLGFERTTLTGSHGEFQVVSLPAGTYSIEVTKQDFTSWTRKLTLSVNQQAKLEVALAVKGATNVGQVTEERIIVRTETAAVGTIIDNRQILALPLDGRNFLELSLLTPGVSAGEQGSAGTRRGELAVHVNGAREDANNFVLDGVQNGDPKLNSYAVNPSVDAVREFEIASNSYDASFGRNAGGQINIVTKSGTNAVHGSAYEFFRNGAMDSPNHFANGDPDYRRNQFGASIGGPV